MRILKARLRPPELACIWGRKSTILQLLNSRWREIRNCWNIQIPPDLVVKLQPTDIIDIILYLIKRPNGFHMACRALIMASATPADDVPSRST
jgi:hypothetical protein